MTNTTTARTRRPAQLSEVQITDKFWQPLRDRIQHQSLPQQMAQMRRPGHQMDALKLAWRPGQDREPHIFWESDIAKWIEAASYVLGRTSDAALERDVDEAIALLAGAQQPDGYLNTYFTVVKPGMRFTDLQDAHELYCLGHLVEAAVAHVGATGKRSLLDLVIRYVDLVDQVFSDDGACAGGYCGHEEIELALVKLSRATGESRYLELARRFVENRGQQPFYFETERARRGTPGYFGSFLRLPVEKKRQYYQCHQPVAEQRKAVGHSVRAMYLYSAMADLAQETGNTGLRSACRALWESVTEHRMYVTGAIGSNKAIEGFSRDYDLPSQHGYGETCAAIGLVMWGQRMANLEADARYVDVAEIALYNGVLSGASLDGTRYFYDNPLASDGTVERRDWFGCACCPPNLARLVSSLESYAYSCDQDNVVVNLYLSSRATFDMLPGRFTVEQSSDYLHGGTVNFRVAAAPAGEVGLTLRIPGWAEDFTLTVNGATVVPSVDQGYVTLRQAWVIGDSVSLRLPVEPRLVHADVAVSDTAGKVAILRGPVVYCLEGLDHDAEVHQLRLAAGAMLRVRSEQLGGLATIEASGTMDLPPVIPRPLYSTVPPATAPATLTMVPYYAWNNRGPSTMTVWMRTGC